jgi:hypothetical protein
MRRHPGTVRCGHLADPLGPLGTADTLPNAICTATYWHEGFVSNAMLLKISRAFPPYRPTQTLSGHHPVRAGVTACVLQCTSVVFCCLCHSVQALRRSLAVASLHPRQMAMGCVNLEAINLQGWPGNRRTHSVPGNSAHVGEMSVPPLIINPCQAFTTRPSCRS